MAPAGPSDKTTLSWDHHGKSRRAKVLSVGCGAPVRYHFSPAREHDSAYLQIDESWRDCGLLADLVYPSLARLRACNDYHLRSVICLKDNWKPKVAPIACGQVTQAFSPGTELDAPLKDYILSRQRLK
jgi:hypothetical protein